jgi:hypothetical protein
MRAGASDEKENAGRRLRERPALVGRLRPNALVAAGDVDRVALAAGADQLQPDRHRDAM